MDTQNIPAELPHPTTLGAPLARGARYLHHFEVELVSDGRRLWAAASAEGQKVLAAIRGEVQSEQDAIVAHQAAIAAAPPNNPPVTVETGQPASPGEGVTTDPANPGNAPGGA